MVVLCIFVRIVFELVEWDGRTCMKARCSELFECYKEENTNSEVVENGWRPSLVGTWAFKVKVSEDGKSLGAGY